jgi:hypothetical protein
MIAGRAALADPAHAFFIRRAMPGLDSTSIRAALPAFHLNPPAHLVNVRGLRIASEINPPVPHIPFAKSETNLIRRLIDADREVPVAKQKAILRV